MSTKKFFRICFILIGVIIAGLLIEGLIQPKDVVVSRSAFIKAPKEVVFQQMVHFKNWRNWSPWTKLDTSMKDSFSVADSGAGSFYHWKGDLSKTGEVEIRNKSISGTAMVFDFELLQPSHVITSGALKAEDSAGGTKATFSFTNHFDYPWNAMTIFMNIDNLLSKDFEAGLNNMKDYIEKK